MKWRLAFLTLAALPFLLSCATLKTVIVDWAETCRLDPSNPICLNTPPSPSPASPVPSPSIPAPTPPPTPAPSPTPSPEATCAPGDAQGYEPVPGTATLSGDVKAAIIRVMDANPSRFERNADGSYLLTTDGARAKGEDPVGFIPPPSDPGAGVQGAFVWFAAALVADLQRAGFCAGFFSDQLEVSHRLPPGLDARFQGYHVHNRGGGNVIFEPPRYEDTLSKEAPPPPPVDPTPAPSSPPSPPATSACPPDAPAFARARLSLSSAGTFPRGRRVDATPVGRDETWCFNNGFLDPDGTGQLYCPYGQEGAGQAQREACETREGPYVWKFEPTVGAPAIEPEGTDNPLQVWLPNTARGLVSICARNGSCSTVVVQP